MKNLIKEIATKYNVNYKALKFFVKLNGIKPKQVTKLLILEILYENCINLFYSRLVENSIMVEFLDIDSIHALILEIEALKEVKNG